MARILVVDDEPKMTSLVCGALEDAGHAVTTTTDPADALTRIENSSFEIVITDLTMPQISGLVILEKAFEKQPIDVVIMTAYATVESAVTAMKKGASDYLVKPFSLDELVLLVERLLEKQKLTALNRHYRDSDRSRFSQTFTGVSPAAEKVKSMIAQVAKTEATVLITGRSGTGKELAARMVHDLSRRREKPFIAINCAAITETLLESELFGHEKGAFTGAVARKLGRFELADKGTIFLDEIGEMSPAMQAKLLRVLEEKKVCRVGGVEMIPVDVRIVTATNRLLKDEVRKGIFREDLYFRLNVFPIDMPPLSERGNDVILLAESFMQSHNYPQPTLSPEVQDVLRAYDWPGNIRELRNILERAMILADGEPLEVEDLAIEAEHAPIGAGSSHAPGQGLETAERELLLGALEQAKGNKTEAAKILKITRRRLYSRLKAHGLPT
uniref:Acetoacetate metabolism regulatory protein AtoC n=1 Tax=uncultured bacterium pAW1 TaxID=1781155 RepID=A0A1C9U4P0_9BACT|nr:acetoacetate metabolism regulatory protein AtoC [uncultured bacterium pAW1]